MVQTTPLRVPCVWSHQSLLSASKSGRWLEQRECSREGSGKTLRHVYFQVELGKINLSLYYSSCAASEHKRQGNTKQWSPTDDFFRKGYAHAARIRSKPSPRLRPSLHPSLAPSHPPCLSRSLPEAPPSLFSCDLPGTCDRHSDL